MSNHLLGQTSPYLLQHTENPVDWYPWCDEAFAKATAEDKPIFLSVGYSTCHWCHVMAHESFEDDEIAEYLNRYFVSIKVDKEERPDIDRVYMSACQAFTGSGGWPMSLFMTPDRKPFFAGTYFPPSARRGIAGLKEILEAIHEKWDTDRDMLLQSADELIGQLSQGESASGDAEEALIIQALARYKKEYDGPYGGFGKAPKFPMPHTLMFLMQQYVKRDDEAAMKMAEGTLRQMYRGGLFDHVGFGFCRYSTDRYFLIPHFEKMLYDNALLIQAYATAFAITKEPLYRDVAEKTAFYVMKQMQSDEGGFYSAQDADSDGEEGRYYAFVPGEIRNLLGEEDAQVFNERYDITERGNFNGKSIPNLLHTTDVSDRCDEYLPKIRAYRAGRAKLLTDDKILTAWNALMVVGLCALYRVSQNDAYRNAATDAMRFIERHLREGNALYVSWRAGKRGEKGFLDEYATYIYALLSLYEVTLDNERLKDAACLTDKVIRDFWDPAHGGFYLYGAEHESLMLRPKETYDGAIPSGNSLMAYNLVRLSRLLPNESMERVTEKQLRFMAGEVKRYPAGYAMYLMALSEYVAPTTIITAVQEGEDISDLPFLAPLGTLIRALDEPTDTYTALNGRATFYVCKANRCMPPVNREALIERYLGAR